ncbi:ROK family protein [Jiella mangrovi]|uniref:ROK family transcriptional regulator n=1 Tax=Jiella mangrovi TaxID=2821407 RepID=A0ABS4BGC3_9HYPH|nr:ROK family transcriptional regulator [Jiella mangrovi]MBP0615805.1 ROK family transcriptional regulator [Jiella mangrovi]
MVPETKSPPILRQISIQSVMKILVKGPRSRADLATDTGLSKQTMSDVIRTLETSGWVREVGTTTGRLGRSAILYEINGKAGVVLGLDIGASRFKLALSDVRGAPLAARELATASLNFERLVDEIVTRAREFVSEVAEGRPLRFTCLATPGVINPETGRLTMAPNLPALTGLDLTGALRKGLECDVIVENDVNAAIVGERWQGEARATEHAAYVALGTGVGLGIVSGGRLMRGATGAAGEVSYLPIGHDTLDPESIDRGALERSLGIGGVLADFTVPTGGAAATIEAFREALGAGDPKALAARQRIGELGAMLVLSVQAMFDPEVIVVGGVLGLAPPVFEALCEEVARRTRRKMALRRGALGLQATVTGATYLALTGMFTQMFSPKLERQWLDLPWPTDERAA